jgi:hypothetical protein
VKVNGVSELVTLAVADFPSAVAVIVAEAMCVAVTRPSVPTAMSVGAELDHVIGVVTVAPDASLATAESCVVAPAWSVVVPLIVTLVTVLVGVDGELGALGLSDAPPQAEIVEIRDSTTAAAARRRVAR